MPVEWTVPAGGPSDDGLVILYLHGGGYSNGLAKWARRGTARLALGTGGRVVAADYRLAPALPVPRRPRGRAGGVRASDRPAGFAPERVAVAGDSAGGALTVSLMADARDRGIPMPACGMLNSLWADIALNTPSLDDPVRNRYDIRREMVEMLSATLLSTGGVDAVRPAPLARLPGPHRPAAAAHPGRRPRRVPRRQRPPRRRRHAPPAST